MYESDGIVSKSVMKFYDLKTGETQKMQPLNSLFGEGCALVNGSVVQLTWQAGKGFIYDPDTLVSLHCWLPRNRMDDLVCSRTILSQKTLVEGY